MYAATGVRLHAGRQAEVRKFFFSSNQYALLTLDSAHTIVLSNLWGLFCEVCQISLGIRGSY